MAKQPERRVVADENHLRIALKQQLLHNEQQNLAMTKMSRTVGRAGRLLGDLNKNIKKVDEGGMMYEAFYEEVKALVAQFEKTSARGSNQGPKRS